MLDLYEGLVETSDQKTDQKMQKPTRKNKFKRIISDKGV